MPLNLSLLDGELDLTADLPIVPDIGLSLFGVTSLVVEPDVAASVTAGIAGTPTAPLTVSVDAGSSLVVGGTVGADVTLDAAGANASLTLDGSVAAGDIVKASGSGAALTLNGPVAAGATVDLAAPNAVLTLGAVRTFGGLITDVNDGDTINLTGLGTGTTVTYDPATGLTIADGTGSTTIAVAPPTGGTLGLSTSGTSVSLSGLGTSTSVTVGSASGGSAAPQVVITGVSGGTNVVDHVVSGTVDAANAGSAVAVYNGATVLGTATADANGAWSLPFVYADDGMAFTYNLTATDTDAAGNTGTSGTTTLALDFTQNEAAFGTVSHSAVTAGGETYALYAGLLGRAPDQVGAEQWAAQIAGGTPVDQVTQAFLTSSEGQFRFTANSDNATFVDQLYHNVLGRAGEATGTAAWINALNNGESRADVADSFVFSDEHIGQLQPAYDAGVFIANNNTSETARLYYGLLDRAPEAAGLQANTQQLNDGASPQALAQTFLNSSEYQSKYAGLSNQDFVDTLYQNALGRAPEPVGGQSWVNALDNGGSRAEVAIGIAESAEARSHLSGKIENGFHFA